MALHFETLAGLVIIVVVIAVGMWIASQARLIDPMDLILSVRDLQLGKEGDGSYQTPIITPNEPFENLEAVRILTTIGEQNLHELGCSIADGIFYDFTAHGISGPRTNEDCIIQRVWTGNPVQQCLVDLKSFVLDDGGATATELASWEATLSSRESPCHVCQEPVGTSITEFDEICINNNLKDRKWPIPSGNNFCDGPISINTVRLTFGNAKCKEGVNSDAWDEHCDGDWLQSQANENWPIDDFCDNKEDRIFWIGSDDNGDLPTVVKDSYTSPYLMSSNDIALSKHYYYIYGTIWVQEASRYDVVFVRTPGQATRNSFGFIKDIFQNKYYIRFNRLGNWRMEARMIVDVIVTPQTPTSLMAIVDELESITIEGVRVKVSDSIEYSCPNCIASEPVSMEGITQNPFSDVYAEFAKLPINITTSLDEGEQLWATAIYRVLIQNWISGWNDNAGSIDRFDAYDRSIIIQEISPPQPPVEPDKAITWTLKVDNSLEPGQESYQSQPGQLCVTGNVFGSSEYCTPMCASYPCHTSRTVTLDKNQPVTLIARPKYQDEDVACIYYSPTQGICNQENDIPKTGTLSVPLPQPPATLPLPPGITLIAYFY